MAYKNTTQNFVNSHIEKIVECKTLLNADEAWVVHFTREDDYFPVWQYEYIRVVHFEHDLEFTEVLMIARWKDGDRVPRKISTLIFVVSVISVACLIGAAPSMTSFSYPSVDNTESCICPCVN